MMRILGRVFNLVDVLMRMPQLQDLRLLFSQSQLTPFDIMASGHFLSHSSSVFSSLKSLAISNACILGGIFDRIPFLERLAVLAIINHPRVAIALSLSQVEDLLKQWGSGGAHLMHLRIMIEEKLSPHLCHSIATYCPNLKVLEVELCGYHDGNSKFTWKEFAEAFARLSHLAFLRICIQFPEYDGLEDSSPWRTTRKECAYFLSSEIPSLKRVGLEYRMRAGTHRFQDAWLEYDIQRRGVRGSEFELVGLGPAWYPFPSVWKLQNRAAWC